MRTMNLIGDSINSYAFESIVSYAEYHHNLKWDITLNDFIKVNDDRIIIISTSNYNDLFIIAFDFIDNYSKMGIRFYHYNLQGTKINKLTKEISSFIYNSFLAFTATILPQNANSNEDNFFSILMIFGYPNGTDLVIDISPYFIDRDNYDSTNNLYNYLIATMEIENNIFGYEAFEGNKLTSIPEEILFYFENGNPLFNNDTLDAKCKLYQNTDKIKEDKLYFLLYQFIVREPDFDTF